MNFMGYNETMPGSSELPLCNHFFEFTKPQDPQMNLLRVLFFVIASISITSLIVVIQTIRSYKVLQAHPSQLIMFICLFEAIYAVTSFIGSAQVTAGFYACYFHLDDLFLVSTFRDLSDPIIQ